MKPYYQEKGITIYHGDCREVLPELYPVDLVLTDPPYGLGVDLTMHERSGEQYGNAAAPKGNYEKTNWDRWRPPRDLIRDVLAKGRYSIIFGGNFFELRPVRCWLIWDKENGDNAFADCEMAWTNLDKPIRIKRHMWNGMLRKNCEIRNGHPTQKPLEVIMWCIQQAPKECQTILDPFMGSGTTLRAAKELGRRATGIEIEEKYCEIAVRRLSQEVLSL